MKKKTALVSKTIFVFIHIDVTNGEYSYDCKSVHEVTIDANKNKGNQINAFGEDHAKNFYSGKGEEDEVGDGIYYFNGGEVATELVRADEITEAEYNVMKKFI